jgi:exodeoxyribonuclease-3
LHCPRRRLFRDEPALKIATFNINGINRRLHNLQDWLDVAKPDVVCLQEIKCHTAVFPFRALAALDYHAICHGQGPHHGVAIICRGVAPIETRRSVPNDPNDREARYIEAAVNGVLIGCIYLPNGNPQPGPKFDYKLAWFERLISHAAELQQLGIPAVLAGDYNVVPTDADIYAVRSWRKNALLQPEAREAYARLLAQGWTDSIRSLHPAQPMYTFWDYLRGAWDRGAGMRLDHLLVSQSLAARLTTADVDRAVRGADGASDHAPAWITID